MKKIIAIFFNPFFITLVFSQNVPNLPVNIYICPIGITNQVQGSSNPESYSTFSSIRIAKLHKEIPLGSKMSTVFYYNGSFDLIHRGTAIPSYTPFTSNPALRLHYFPNDIATVGFDVNGATDFTLGTSQKGEQFKINNYRLRLRPLLFLCATPNLIIQQMATFGISRYSAPSLSRLGSYEAIVVNDSINQFSANSMQVWDYNIYKYRIKAIYFTPFHMSIALVPQVYSIQFRELAARHPDNLYHAGKRPPLREMGYGVAFGLRYTPFRLGKMHALFEFIHNIDQIFGANTYYQYSIAIDWKNEFITERLGYFLNVQWMTYSSDENVITGFSEVTGGYGTRSEWRIALSCIPLVRLNRYVSLAPEYFYLFEKGSSSIRYKKTRIALNMYLYF